MLLFKAELEVDANKRAADKMLKDGVLKILNEGGRGVRQRRGGAQGDARSTSSSIVSTTWPQTGRISNPVKKVSTSSYIFKCKEKLSSVC